MVENDLFSEEPKKRKHKPLKTNFELPKLRNGTSVMYLAHQTTIKNAVWGMKDLYELHGLDGAFHESEFVIIEK